MDKCNIILRSLMLFILLACSQESNLTNPSNSTISLMKVDHNGLSEITAVMDTTKGRILFKFYPDDAPLTVGRVLELINNKFYDGLNFHRISENFIIQTGLQQEQGATNNIYSTIPFEVNTRHHLKGAMGFAHGENKDSGATEFYITLATLPHLDKDFTVFGQVIDGIDILSQIRAEDKITSINLINSLQHLRDLPPTSLHSIPSETQKESFQIKEPNSEVKALPKSDVKKVALPQSSTP